MKEDKAYVMIGIPIPKDCKVDVQVAMWIGMMSTHPNVQIMGKITGDPTEARNLIVQDVLKNPKITHVFFIDADTRVPRDVIHRLLKHNKDVVAGVTPMFWNHQKWWSAGKDTNEAGIVKWLSYNELPDKPFKAKAVGGTTILIRRKVLEAMKWPYYYTHYSPNGGRTGEDVYFSCSGSLWW